MAGCLVARVGVAGCQRPGSTGGSAEVIHVAVDQHRHLVERPGVQRHRMAGFGDRVRWNLGPPRVRCEQAVLDCAADAATDLDAVAGLTDACGSRRTTASRLLTALDGRSRIAQHGYLTLVERPHGLPDGRRRARARTDCGSVYRDVDYEALGLVVELDGRLFHESVAARAGPRP